MKEQKVTVSAWSGGDFRNIVQVHARGQDKPRVIAVEIQVTRGRERSAWEVLLIVGAERRSEDKDETFVSGDVRK